VARSGDGEYEKNQEMNALKESLKTDFQKAGFGYGEKIPPKELGGFLF